MTQETAPNDLAARLADCASQLMSTARHLEWRGPDPYDGLYWRWPSVMTSKPRRRQIVVQLHARAPINIRAWRRGPRPRLAKTLALFGKAGLVVDEAAPSADTRGAAEEAIEILDADRSAGERAWGYPFPVQTRWSSYPANSPNVVVTSFAIDALLLAAERLHRSTYADRARGAGHWLIETLVTRQGYFAYHEHSDVLIHNANMLGAAAVHQALGDRESASRAVESTLRAQRTDGSWPYGQGSTLGFVDNFHTAYVLNSLLSLRDIDPAINTAIARGASYWVGHFFDPEGRALLWPDRRFPKDGHSTGTALTTLSRLARHNPSYMPLLEQLAEHALTKMIIAGRTVHRRYAFGPLPVHYLRWCDAHMAAGMANASRLVANPPSDA